MRLKVVNRSGALHEKANDRIIEVKFSDHPCGPSVEHDLNRAVTIDRDLKRDAWERVRRISRRPPNARVGRGVEILKIVVPESGIFLELNDQLIVEQKNAPK